MVEPLPLDQTLDRTYHEKMEIITRWHCEPLRTKGYRIRENAVCEIKCTHEIGHS